MGTARALVGGWGSWPACKARVSKPWGICVVSVSLMSSRLLSDVVHRGLAGPCRRVGDGSRAEDGASAGAHLAPYGRDQGLRLVAAVSFADVIDLIVGSHGGKGRRSRGGVDGEHVAAALAALAVHQPALSQVMHDLR